jgi:pimeloyl-ACP methyl ester carboxylesterase/DNA-binding SARP family transcriptional activator
MQSVRTDPFAEALARSPGTRLCLLGVPALLSGKRLAPLVLRPKALALLTYLALADGDVGRREVARLLFPEAEGPLAALRWHVAHLRAAAPVARRFRATRDALVLQVPTDVALFRRGAAVVTRRPATRGAAGILELYRGDLVSGLAVSTTAEFENWLYVTQESLRRSFRQAALAFARWALETRHAREAIEPLARLVTLDPYCEDGHVLLIHAYEAVGQSERAAAAYDRYQRIVRRELAAEPRPSVAMRYEGQASRRRILPREDLVSLRDVTLHVVDWPGKEPAILAIHGSAQMGHTFGALADRLAPTHRFVGVDLRGHGFSDKPPTGYDLERHVDDMRQLIQTMPLKRPVLLGHSAGGTIATFAATRTDVAGIILLEGMIGDRAFMKNAAAQAAPLAESLGLPVAGFDTYFEAWRARFGPIAEDAERLVERWVRYALAPLPDGRYRERALRIAVEAEWESIIKADALGALARVTCPILIVYALKPWIGGRPYFSREIVDAQLRAAPSAQLFVAQDSDHGTMIRNPEPGMVEAITKFVTACARR